MNQTSHISHVSHILAIDAGGTKTVGLLKCLATGETWYVRGDNASLSHDLQQACERINSLSLELVNQASCDSNKVLLICGAAGGGHCQNRNALIAKLNQTFAHVKVFNDGRTSLFGVAKGKPAIVLAMGTGSVAMRLDRKGNEARFGGWGFIAGDLGSGANMGRQLVKVALVEYDKRQIKNDSLINETISRIKKNSPSSDECKNRDNAKRYDSVKNLDAQLISNWIKNATPTDYAAFAPLIFEYAEQSSFADEIIKKSAFRLEDLARTAGYETQEYGDLPLIIVGGLAQVIKPYLSKKMLEKLVPSEGNSLDGALYLGEQIAQKYLKRSYDESI